MAFVPSSFLFLGVRPGAPSSILAPSSDALCSFRSILAPNGRFDVVDSLIRGSGKVKFGGGFYCGCLNGLYVGSFE